MDILIALHFFSPLLGMLLLLVLPHYIKGKSVLKVVSLFVLLVTISMLAVYSSEQNGLDLKWGFSLNALEMVGASFSFAYTGLGGLMCFLTSLTFTVISFLPAPATVSTKRGELTYYTMLLMCQSALYGVFMVSDGLFFYFFWELTLIPIVFISAFFGGASRMQVTSTFFLYTVAASLLMLVGLLCVYAHTPDRSFAYHSFVNTVFQNSTTGDVIFGLMFVAFAVKTPLFPFHSWQPSLYVETPTALTILLSAVVAKMGLFGIFHWLLPIASTASITYARVVILLAVVGLLYGSIIALKQVNIKRLLAYSSLAHLGLMGAALFANNSLAMQGMLLQLLAHGIAVIGLWWVVHYIECLYNSVELSSVSGLAYRSPFLAVVFAFFALANIALPLTGNFVGEWMMFAGLVSSTIGSSMFFITLICLGAVSIVLGAIYTMRLLQSVLYGKTLSSQVVCRVGIFSRVLLVTLMLLSLWIGIYPSTWIDLLKIDVQLLLSQINGGLL